MSSALRTMALAILVLVSPYTARAVQAQQAGPTTVSGTAGFHPLSSKDALSPPNAVNASGAVDAAMLIGGGAALIIGIVVGGTAGIVLAVAGGLIAVIALVLLLS
jgi:hypothetical protein